MLAVVIEELMRILKKDFMKRMVEMNAFKTYETWWDENQSSYQVSCFIFSTRFLVNTVIYYLFESF